MHNYLGIGGMALVCWLSVAGLAAEDGKKPLVNSIGLKLARIPAGEFWQGSKKGDAFAEVDEFPRHVVRISQPFSLGLYEVTQDEYQQVMGENPSWFSADGPGREKIAGQPTGRLPVDMVSWHDAVEFCRRLSALPAERAAGRKYRLPTEAEWEYAARGGATGRYASGDKLTAADGNVNDGPRSLDSRLFGATRPVGSYRPNGFGLYDVHGNVWEWCADWYFAGYDAGPVTDPTGPDSGTGRVVRGGEWSHSIAYSRLANRDFTRATRRDLGNGFRVACDIASGHP
ncbi:MAG: formylglycine-generating enzyme family protein [Pirellulales bacterium]